LLVTGLSLKIFNTDLEYFSASTNGKYLEIIVTGNWLLIFAFLFSIPLLIILRRRKTNGK
jgi:hypothetical protein